MPVVVVESPAKAKTIEKYLGSGYMVLSSFGHVRDLISKNGSVDPDNDFSMQWEIDSQSKKRLQLIENALKNDNTLILATDPDREGEAISWHLLESLSLSKTLRKNLVVKRVTFNAITKNAILRAMEEPRSIDSDLVNAYLARRALDYLFGFSLSPILWRKLPGSRSAGRVQSPALRLVVDREIEIESFVKQEYWTIHGTFFTDQKQAFSATAYKIRGEKLEKFDLCDESTAKEATSHLASSTYKVASVITKPVTRKPQAPFITSTLQQEASRKLGFSLTQTMRVAQKLYEGIAVGNETIGLITYMRTDGVDMAPEAVQQAREVIENSFGKKYLPKSPNVYKSKIKNAQEAHECIRPTDISLLPNQLTGLPEDFLQLYELVWKRAVASQMEKALFERTTIDILSQDETNAFRATGQVAKFDGFLKLYQEGKDNPEDTESQTLPEIASDTLVDHQDITPEQHFTQPPPRYTEASLIKTMEELGIGRPSTYESVITVIKNRGYVKKEKNRLVAEDKGLIVITFLKNFFEQYIEYNFTAELEKNLDDVSGGQMEWKALLHRFWEEFSKSINQASQLRTYDVLEKIEECLEDRIFPEGTSRKCPECSEGKLSLKASKFGAFLGCSLYPDCGYTRPLGTEEGNAANEPLIGHDDTGTPILLCSGRFGPYIQAGEGAEAKKVTIPKHMNAQDVSLASALDLLSLPRLVGEHEEKPITAGVGRYGPYISHNSVYVSLKNFDDVFSIGANLAISLLEEKKERTKKKPGKIVGQHPDGGDITIASGRYGAYIKWKSNNVALPKTEHEDSITLETCLELIEKKLKKPEKKPTKKKTKTAEKKKSKDKA